MPAVEFVSPEALLQIFDLTRQLFPGTVTVEQECDPSEPGDPWVVFNVKAGGESGDLYDRRYHWHDEVEKLFSGHLPQIRLAVYVP